MKVRCGSREAKQEQRDDGHDETISESMSSRCYIRYKYNIKKGGETELPVTCYFQLW